MMRGVADNDFFNRDRDLDRLWGAVPVTERVFIPEEYHHLPLPVQRYLNHAIAPGTRLATAVRLKMHGGIKLGKWHPFRAEQVISAKQGMIWQAIAWMNGLPVSGWDRLLDNEGAMRWKLLGVFTVMAAQGDDITKSAIGRIQCETVWFPSILCNPQITWNTARAQEEEHLNARFSLYQFATDLHLSTNADGALNQVYLRRWGNPEGGAYRYFNFGGVVGQEHSFAGFTIPSQLEVGWYFNRNSQEVDQAHDFESVGKFFKVTIDEAEFK